MSKSDYAPPKGDKQCTPHRLELAKDKRAHLWTDGEGNNWWCFGYENKPAGELPPL